ncbi:nucleotidyltransferase family protein [Pseudomonas stutzeri]|uniref:nucleotidyltransferase family protein n=1 Tax=Stutzerimonas stutzeri TaxID=316 RepID=UPI00210B244E|nr:nucleotidyltransferase family protein [Stutzerimonas stutzeri]MCQ4288821.1 nucleotidyltransferase family protein [Stutzerimonas stutzeri]
MTSLLQLNSPTDVMVLVLAAGRGERFSVSGGAGHKLDAVLAGQSVLSHVLNAVEAAGLKSFLVRPEGGTAGMGESIAMGVRATANAPAWMILPGDLPLIRASTIRQVAQALVENPIVVPNWRSRRGHPVGFQRQYFAELAALQGDTGASVIVRGNKLLGRVLELSVEDAGAIIDVDTCDDLTLARHLLQIRQTSDFEGEPNGKY